MLETLREYAGSVLAEQGEDDRTRRRHAAYFSGLAEQAEPLLTSAERGPWVNRLRAELENLRAALMWLQTHDVEAALRLAGNLSWFWYYEGHFREGRQSLELAANATGINPVVRARALLGAARLAAYGGDEAAAVASIDEILQLTREHDDVRRLAYALHFAGVLFAETDRARARPALCESISIFRELGDKWGLALALSYDGMVAFHDGDEPHMEAALEEGSRLFEELDDPWGLSGVVFYRGLHYQRRGDLQSASRLLEQCEALVRRTGDRWRLAAVLDSLAELRSQQGQDPAPLLEERDMLLEDLGVPAALLPAQDLKGGDQG
jgi:tetratricopeptide (TPR) repeat protein